MIGILLVICAIPLAGLPLSRRLWRGEETERAEQALSAIVLGSAAWLALTWVLALTGLLTRITVLALAAAFVVAALPQFRAVRPLLTWRTALFGAPVATWLGYVAWRAPFIPPANHDALAYHFTKAVLLARNHGFARFAAPDGRISDLPSNYELLLAQVLLGTGSDAVTEWISVACFLALLVATAALVQRWWTSSAPAAEAVLAVAAAPVALLASGADKNDLLTTVFCVAALLWGARWAVTGGRAPMVLTAISIAIAIGTKPTAGVIVFGAGVPLLLRVLRIRPSPRDLALTAGLGLSCFLLLGGAAYIANVIETGSPTGGSISGDEASNGAQTGYGDYANLLRVPYLMLTAPFSGSASHVWVPWRGEYWFWPRYELFSSHFGAHFTFIVLLLPLALLTRLAPERRRERMLGALATLIAVLVFLPLEMRPLGFFNAFPRYLLFLVPVVCALAIPAALSLARRAAIAICAALIVFFIAHALEYGARDRFVPFDYARAAATIGGTRTIFFRPQRAGSAVDRVAGPHDTIAFLGGFDSWTYPAYGPELSRNVLFLPLTATASDVPPQARWVVIDRGWRIIWGDPTFEHMGQFDRKTSRGRAGPDDLRLFQSLEHDCRFALIYRDRRLNQALFFRVPPGRRAKGQPPGC
ncbi:MAG TPA: hypothetical protein VE974_17465 [Thermoanaerobaculia bacterium]|nr:hypothetical protein [Thermoanaerobaculia bacterium]